MIVGVTSLDVGLPIFTFVFGRARQGGSAAVVSLARLEPAFYGLAPDAETGRQEMNIIVPAHPGDN